MVIRPFKALRPVRDKVHLVATRPFYSYKKNVLRAKLQSNPFTFLHIINPNFNLLNETLQDKSSRDKHLMVRQKYEEFIEKGILVRDVIPSIYVYRQSHHGNVYTGIITAANIEDYINGQVKKHEATITSREIMFTEYLETVGYNAEPVLLCHEPSEKLDEILRKITEERPEYEFTTTDNLKHELWVTSVADGEIITQLFEDIEVSYIADGHHRCASSAALYKKRQKEKTSNPNDGYFLSFLIDETKIKVFEYNRLIKNTTGIQSDALLQALRHNFEIEHLSSKRKPRHEHEIIMIFEEKWYALKCKDAIVDDAHPIKSLDAEILTEYVLTPILGISDLKTDQNVGFISGVEDINKLDKKMQKGNYDLAFLLFPVRIDQVKLVADNQMIMPPKSTWIEPKMRSGLTVYCIDK